MAKNKGKEFERRFLDDWKSTVDNSMAYRLYDVTIGYKSIAHAGDFICYKYPHCFILDTKSKEGNTLPFSDLRQYDKMLEYRDIKGLHVGFIVWFIDHDKIIWLPVETMKKIKNNDLKSFNINKMKSEDYFFLEIPSKKLRTFMSSDYSKLVEYYNGESRD